MATGARDTEQRISLYYKDWFPFDQVYAWFSGGEHSPRAGDEWKRREIAFWSAQWPGVSRWKSPGDRAAAFRALALRQAPNRMELGAVYGLPVDERPTLGPHAYAAVARELTFDLDVDQATDAYRNCCTGKTYCRRCWLLVNSAMCILDHILTAVYGFRRRTWVFSGRRGVHCWVLDERAFHMNEASRGTLVDYVDRAGRFADTPAAYRRHRRSAAAAGDGDGGGDEVSAPLLDMLDWHFARYLGACPTLFQGPLVAETVKRLAATASDAAAHAVGSLLAASSAQATATATFAEVLKTFAVHSGEPASSGRFKRQVQAAFCWPKLDQNVTRQLNHLLKMPFCVHPDTGNVCAALDPAAIRDFYPSPDRVPNVADLYDERSRGRGTEQAARSAALLRASVDLLSAGA